jgi:hypothetical protein
MNDETRLRTDLSSEPFAIEEAPTFHDGAKFTVHQLDQIATVMIYSSYASEGEQFVRETGILLSQGQWRHRYRHELLCEQGGPDPAYTVDRFGHPTYGMFWRSHPDGLSTCDPEERALLGKGFYR